MMLCVFLSSVSQRCIVCLSLEQLVAATSVATVQTNKTVKESPEGSNKQASKLKDGMKKYKYGKDTPKMISTGITDLISRTRPSVRIGFEFSISFVGLVEQVLHIGFIEKNDG